eukprot:4120079-Lingulodinium_polyedra.AAC.1
MNARLPKTGGANHKAPPGSVTGECNGPRPPGLARPPRGVAANNARRRGDPCPRRRPWLRTRHPPNLH